MANSIDGVGGNHLDPTQQVKATEVREHERPIDARRERETPGDRVSLTPEAQRLKALEASVAQQPVVDAQKVERIRNELAQGRYQIDPERVADKMMQFEQQVFGASKDG